MRITACPWRGWQLAAICWETLWMDLPLTSSLKICYSPKGPDSGEPFSSFWEVTKQGELGAVVKFLEIPRTKATARVTCLHILRPPLNSPGSQGIHSSELRCLPILPKSSCLKSLWKCFPWQNDLLALSVSLQQCILAMTKDVKFCRHLRWSMTCNPIHPSFPSSSECKLLEIFNWVLQ